MLQNVPMKFRRVSFARRALAGAALALSTFAAAQTSPFQFNLPPDYLNRFGGAEPVVSSTDGYGVRGFPLPTPLDLRVSLVKAPTYWDGGLSLRASDTTFRVGRFYNVPTLEITHDPYKGAQFSGVVRGEGGLSVFSGGYASTSWQDRVRVLNNVGVAFKGEVTAPYTRSEVSVGYGQPFGAFNTYVAATARAYTFPLQREVQGSVDFYASASVSPVKGLLLSASHFERFVAGTSAVPDFALGRYQESNLNATYRLDSAWPVPEFGLGAVRARSARNWTNDYTYVYGDVFLRTSLLPTMFGPSVGYRVDPGGKTGLWLFSLVTLGL